MHFIFKDATTKEDKRENERLVRQSFEENALAVDSAKVTQVLGGAFFLWLQTVHKESGNSHVI